VGGSGEKGCRFGRGSCHIDQLTVCCFTHSDDTDDAWKIVSACTNLFLEYFKLSPQIYMFGNFLGQMQ